MDTAAARNLMPRYTLHFPVIAVLAFVLIRFATLFPDGIGQVLFYAVVLGGWMSSSFASHQLLASRLAGKRTGMDPWMQVLLTVAWSVVNLIVIGAIVVGLTLILRPVR